MIGSLPYLKSWTQPDIEFSVSVGGSDHAKQIDLRMHFVHKARAAGQL
jgi:hypothetical protein